MDPRFTTRILVVLAALGLAHKEEDRYGASSYLYEWDRLLPGGTVNEPRGALESHSGLPRRAPGFRSTKQPAEVCFRAVLTDGAQEEVRFERVAVG